MMRTLAEETWVPVGEMVIADENRKRNKYLCQFYPWTEDGSDKQAATARRDRTIVCVKACIEFDDPVVEIESLRTQVTDTLAERDEARLLLTAATARAEKAEAQCWVLQTQNHNLGRVTVTYPPIATDESDATEGHVAKQLADMPPCKQQHLAKYAKPFAHQTGDATKGGKAL